MSDTRCAKTGPKSKPVKKPAAKDWGWTCKAIMCGILCRTQRGREGFWSMERFAVEVGKVRGLVNRGVQQSRQAIALIHVGMVAQEPEFHAAAAAMGIDQRTFYFGLRASHSYWRRHIIGCPYSGFLRSLAAATL